MMRPVARHSMSKRVLSTIGVFGGAQAVTIFCSLIRIKLVALWIGAAGVGLFGLYNAAVELIAAVTQFNMRSTAVRDIALARLTDRAHIFAVVRRWAWFLGLSGALLTLVSAPMLSRWTFGDDAHCGGFMWLSVVLLISSLAGGELAIMQGSGLLRRLARASLWGGVGGLVLSVPLFYFFRLDSVVPSIAVYSLATLVAALFIRERPEKVHMSCRDTMMAGAGFIKLGAWMTVSSFMAVLAQYAIVAYINTRGGMAETGYFQAGYTLVNRYVAVLFAAIGMEFYPRIASSVRSGRTTSVYVSHEIAVISVLLVPAVVLFIVFRHMIIWLLYTPDFYCIETYISWAVAGMPFRAVGWCMAYVIVARGDGLVYMLTEVTSALVYFFARVVLYGRYGLDGAGYAYIIWYAIYMCIVGAVYFGRYGLRLSYRAAWLVAVSSVAGALSVLLTL